MSVSRATAEVLAREVADLYAEAERVMLARIARNLKKGISGPYWAEQKLASLQAYEAQTRRLLADLEKQARTGVDTALTRAYERGGLAAVKDMEPILGKDMRPVQPLPGVHAVEMIAAETMEKLAATSQRVLVTTRALYREAVEAGVNQVLLGTQTRIQATQNVLDRFAAKGITGFVDKAGRSWDLASYAEMATRAGTMNATVAGHVDTLTANGLDLVIVSAHGSPCKLCAPWEGKVLSIGGEQQAVEEAVPPPIWQPEMTADQAEAWAQGSAYADRTFYHYTSEAGEAGIKSGGFNLSDGNYGRAIYLTDDARGGGGVARQWSNERLEVMVRSDKPLEFSGLSAMHRWEDEFMLADEEFEDAVRRLGYDSVRINFKTKDPYTMVFDKHRVVVVKL